jgi:K+-transporting ATPase c subunit
LNEESLKNLIAANIEKLLLGIFGTESVNILGLNIALDKLK